MGTLRSFLARPRSDKTLLFCALGWLGAVRASLSLLRFRRTRRWLQRIGSGARGAASDPELDLGRVRWAISAASRLLPGTRCLAQALAGQVLLARRGVPTSLRIGVERSSEAMSAHAWLEQDGRVVLGEARPDEFTPLSDLDGRSSTGSPLE